MSTEEKAATQPDVGMITMRLLPTKDFAYAEGGEELFPVGTVMLSNNSGTVQWDLAVVSEKDGETFYSIRNTVTGKLLAAGSDEGARVVQLFDGEGASFQPEDMDAGSPRFAQWKMTPVDSGSEYDDAYEIVNRESGLAMGVVKGELQVKAYGPNTSDVARHWVI